MLQELFQGQDGFLVSPPSHSVDDVSNYVPVGIPELCWIWHALFFFLFPLFQVKCEARSALNKPKNNHNNCKKVSNEEKPKVAIGEECRADEQAFLVALYKYILSVSMFVYFSDFIQWNCQTSICVWWFKSPKVLPDMVPESRGSKILSLHEAFYF